MPSAIVVKRLTRVLWASTLPISLAALVPTAAQAASFNRLFAFGDSLSDPGNTSAATLTIIPPKVLPGLDQSTGTIGLFPAYTQGRFADEFNWLDYLAPKLGVSDTVNFAFGGATTGTLNTTPIPFLPGLTQQLGAFSKRSITPTDDDLFVIWAGNNDYLAVAGQQDPTIPVANLEGAIRTLTGAGAKNLLIANLPDLGKTPLVKSRANASQVSALISQHNSLLADKLVGLKQEAAFADVNLFSLDVYSLINGAFSDPAAQGFTNVSDACLFPSPLFFLPPPSIITKCANPDEYLFWDSLHPTSRAHQIVADTAFALLDHPDSVEPDSTAAVPEPGMGVAFSIVGGALVLAQRQRKKSPVPLSSSGDN